MKTKREALEMFRVMSDEELMKQRDIISSSMDYQMKTKDFLIEAIDSCLNRKELTQLAMIPEADIQQGEV